jgi:hypothetical protein
MLRGYRLDWLRHDLVARRSVAAVARPTAIACAELAAFPRKTSRQRCHSVDLLPAGSNRVVPADVNSAGARLLIAPWRRQLYPLYRRRISRRAIGAALGALWRLHSGPYRASLRSACQNEGAQLVLADCSGELSECEEWYQRE